jgi:D-alanyl-D-alanine carboxypeptidase/D-alanyl-D-alanine-endopeptidase (penicillin-binding protein 4)
VTDPQQPLTRREARDSPPSSNARREVHRGSGADSAGPTARNSRTPLIVAAAAIAFVLLATGSLFAGMAAGRASQGSTAAGGSQAAARQLPGSVPAGQSIATCSISKLAASSKLDTMFGTVYSPDQNKSVWTQNGDQQERPAGVQKVLIAAAALAELGPDYRFTTTVELGNAPGTIVLVGHGDATLSRLPTGQTSVYAGAAHMDALAQAALAAYNLKYAAVPITQVVLDDSYWDDSDKWNTDWNRSEQTGGYLSEVTALQVDGDRLNPRSAVSARSTNPVQRAGNAFVTALGIPGVTTTIGSSENGAPVLATASSQPLKTLIGQMLQPDDNTLAEMMARVVSRHSGKDGSAASIQAAVTGALGKYGLSTADVTLVDGSGVSPGDALSADFMAQFMEKVLGKSKNLNIVYDALPTAGKSGSLAGRFTGSSAAASGHVRAKPGSIDSAVTLSGIVNAKDGTTLTFAFFAIRDSISPDAQSAMDALTAGVYRCGKNLTSN